LNAAVQRPHSTQEEQTICEERSDHHCSGHAGDQHGGSGAEQAFADDWKFLVDELKAASSGAAVPP